MRRKIVRGIIFMILAAAGAFFLVSCPGPNPNGPVSGSGPDAFILNEQINGVYTNDGSASFSRTQAASDSNKSSDGVIYDFDSDGDLDVFVVTYNGPNKIYLNAGGGTFYVSDADFRNDKGTAAASGDFNGDGNQDVIVANESEENIVYLGTGGGIFAERIASSDTKKSWGVAAGDIDGDGDTDAVVANHYQDKSRIYTNDGSGNFTVTDLTSTAYVTSDIELGDIDGDGDLDVFLTNDNHENLVLWNDGSGNFTEENAHSTVRNSAGVALGDLDDDGDLDAFVVNSYSSAGSQYQKNQILLYNSVEGTFASQDASNKTLLGSDVELADLDGDTDLDAVVVNYGDPNTIYLNDGTGSFSASTAPGPQTDSFNLTIADFTAP
jgi:hypothetical protein